MMRIWIQKQMRNADFGLIVLQRKIIVDDIF